MFELRKQLTGLEKLRYEVSMTRVEWHEKLLNERERLRMPKDAKFTEFDRKSISEASTSAIERDYEFLIAIELIIKERLELGQVLLQTI